MHTTKDKEFDYQVYMRQEAPDSTKIQRGPQARQKRRETAKSRITIRIDTEVIEQFKQLVPAGQGYQSLINHALREWLVAQGVKELVRDELKEMTEQLVASLHAASTSPPSKQ